MPPTDEALARLAQLWARVDQFFARVHERHPGALTCASGCSDCCQTRFSVTRLEARALRLELARLPAAARQRLAARALTAGPACPMLEPDGRCAVYAARPLFCRTHGLALRLTPEPDTHVSRRLPVLDACPRNFRGVPLESLAADSVLDQRTVSTVLAALEALECARAGLEPGERVELCALAGEGV